VQLGLVAFALGNVEDAQRSFEAALAASPDDGAAMVGLADVHKVAGRFTEAEALYEKAIALAPDNALHELDFGEYCETRAKAETDPAKRREWLRAARRHYVRSHALDPETPETLWAYGQTFLVDGEPPEKGLEALAEAHARLPASPPIKLAYARVLARVGRRDEARAQLRRLLAWSHAELAAEAEQLLAELDAKPLEQATPSQ
jgi:tetratricopeptide (TPR) repeat protein